MTEAAGIRPPCPAVDFFSGRLIRSSKIHFLSKLLKIKADYSSTLCQVLHLEIWSCLKAIDVG